MFLQKTHISREHLQHVVNHNKSRVGHIFNILGLQVAKFHSQQSQVNHGVRGIKTLQVSEQFVDITSKLSEQVLGRLQGEKISVSIL